MNHQPTKQRAGCICADFAGCTCRPASRHGTPHQGSINRTISMGAHVPCHPVDGKARLRIPFSTVSLCREHYTTCIFPDPVNHPVDEHCFCDESPASQGCCCFSIQHHPAAVLRSRHDMSGDVWIRNTNLIFFRLVCRHASLTIG